LIGIGRIKENGFILEGIGQIGVRGERPSEGRGEERGCCIACDLVGDGDHHEEEY
jgi:hypothetical protein